MASKELRTTSNCFLTSRIEGAGINLIDLNLKIKRKGEEESG